MRLYLLRHTKPVIAAGVCYGQSDVAVREEDFLPVVAALRRRWPDGIPVYASPLQRCAVLAHQLRGQPQFDPRLMELNFGDWEMRAWDDIPRHAIDAWAASPTIYQPGGGESAFDVAVRVLSWLEDIRDLDAPEILVVCHAGVMRMLNSWQDGMSAMQLAEVVCSSQQTFDYAEMCELLVFE
ncbi:histidine phosphatase family protein [Undibacterium sp. TS12]|uniref:histidine phosphatase family protein n=1 Tax=Undibacterium sp. TS12 TaxID=2908202 RepID=UPI001F4CBF96|nr:histidine phosphatase family protein [Undibacterium sp. TS12]MCH8622106.1 histidine phosphatase family protein [Undibacterium sp. TS12]